MRPLIDNRSFQAFGIALGLLAAAAATQQAQSQTGDTTGIDVRIAYLRVEREPVPILSNIDPAPDRLGIEGAELGIADNATTGRFLGQKFNLDVVTVPLGEDVLAAARAINSGLLVIDAPADTLLAVADLPEMAERLILNVGAQDTRLRDDQCRANVLHAVPSLAMRADALMQFLSWRRRTDLVMVRGPHPRDRAFADALERATSKFGLRIRATRDWTFDADMRRNAAREVPAFTQDFGDYDTLLVADEIGDFGRYIPYNTWMARPVAGSEGLSPKTWDRVVEQWGAAQLQSRFAEATGRDMLSTDYAAWAAVSAIGESVTRSGSVDPRELREFMLGPEFELAGFKGRPLTFRRWNGQLRQPIALVHPRALVASAPIEGFLHQRTELDTLGLDQPESACQAFSLRDGN